MELINRRWHNVKWFIKEVGKIYSSGESYFSKKRIESGVAFVVAQWGMIMYLQKKYEGLSMSDMALWAGIEFAISGYILNQIQKEKKEDATEPAA